MIGSAVPTLGKRRRLTDQMLKLWRSAANATAHRALKRAEQNLHRITHVSLKNTSQDREKALTRARPKLDAGEWI